MALNKPAIISNNNGLINEINEENRNLIFNVNNIEKSTQFDYVQPKFNYNYIIDEEKFSVLNALN